MTLLRRWIGLRPPQDPDEQPGRDGPAVIRAFLRNLARLDEMARSATDPEAGR